EEEDHEGVSSGEEESEQEESEEEESEEEESEDESESEEEVEDEDDEGRGIERDEAESSEDDSEIDADSGEEQPPIPDGVSLLAFLGLEGDDGDDPDRFQPSAEFLEDLMVTWDFLQLMGQDVMRIDAESPLGMPRGSLPPSLKQLYAGIVMPERGWLNALQLRLVDLIYSDIVKPLDAASTGSVSAPPQVSAYCGPTSSSWPEFARQGLAAVEIMRSDLAKEEASEMARNWLQAQHAAREGGQLVGHLAGSTAGHPNLAGYSTKHLDGLLLSVISDRISYWRANNTSLVEAEMQEMTALAVKPARQPLGLRPPSGRVPGAGAAAARAKKMMATGGNKEYIVLSKYKMSNIRRFITPLKCKTVPRWVEMLLELRDVQAKNGAAVRNLVHEVPG
ncbi:unnamed protein product, partial [Chrysoparadoxa australica]